MPGTLYMVGTPIGNMGDITVRAMDILQNVTAVACEDTRVTAKLMNHLAIKKPLIALHHHSSERVIGGVLSRLLAGEIIAYVSDAGTPGIADPGGKLVKAAVAAGITVVPIPGPSAITALLSVAGLPANEYAFLGYPPHKKGRQTFFKEVAQNSHAVVFYESTHRIQKCLSELEAVVPKRYIVVGRELTKLYETIYRGLPVEVIAAMKNTSTKGEFVIVVAP